MQFAFESGEDALGHGVVVGTSDQTHGGPHAGAPTAFAKLYDHKTPITAAEIINDRVLPSYERHGIRLSRLLTDRGTYRSTFLDVAAWPPE